MNAHILSDALVQTLAEIVTDVIRRQDRLIDWALENGVEPIIVCSCRYRRIDAGCVCNVELRVGRRWMGVVAKQVAARKSRGMLPRRVCRLCRHGEHDLEPTKPIKIVGRDGAEIGTSHVASRARRFRKDDLDRAARAGGVRPGSRDEQLQLAGLK